MKLVKSLTATTNGKGFWSDVKRTVKIDSIVIDSIVDIDGYRIRVGDVTTTPDTMYLAVFFSKKSWDNKKHGLIYTDEKWIAQLRKGLRSIGLVTKGIDYTEQGMQGADYVSLAIYGDQKTIASFRKVFE